MSILEYDKVELIKTGFLIHFRKFFILICFLKFFVTFYPGKRITIKTFPNVTAVYDRAPIQ